MKTRDEMLEEAARSLVLSSTEFDPVRQQQHIDRAYLWVLLANQRRDAAHVGTRRGRPR